MAERKTFEGKIVRLEKDGFGVIEFDQALGANTHGIFSPTTSEPGLRFQTLKKGMHVAGEAEVDDKDVAAIKTLSEL